MTVVSGLPVRSMPDMTHTQFRHLLQERLAANRDRILLRVVVAPRFEKPLELTGAGILERADKLVASLALPKERSVVLLLLPHSAELFLLHLGLILKGHIPAILAWPTSRVDPEKYQRNLVHQLSNLPADLFVTLPRLAENLAPGLPYSVAGLAMENGAAYERAFPEEPVREHLAHGNFLDRDTHPSEDTVFLQFSGGTTGAQKAIVVSASMLCRQFELLRDALRFTPEDGVVSWLPLYHDMGLIACFWMPLWHGAPSLQIGANDWVMNPELLFKYVSRYRPSFCWLPNFAFSYLAKRREQMKGEHRLDSIRAWINCSEPVRLGSMTLFSEAFARWGVRKQSMQASYAMAETVFAITQSELERAPLTVPRNRLRQDARNYCELAFDLIDGVYVSCGKPLQHTEIKIVAADGTVCADQCPGEIYVRMPSLFSGYWGADGFKTHSLHAGWHATGDFGFVSGSELFVIGRLKDIAIIGGQNVFPEDVEAIVNTVDGVYPGRVVVFGVDDQDYGTQSLAVVAEAKEDCDEDRALELEAAIRKLVVAAVGIAPRYVAIVPRRWIVKSTAGKISRRETRERFVHEWLTLPKAEVA